MKKIKFYFTVNVKNIDNPQVLLIITQIMAQHFVGEV